MLNIAATQPLASHSDGATVTKISFPEIVAKILTHNRVASYVWIHKLCVDQLYAQYRIAGNFERSKFWRMTQILRFGEFNFGVKCLAHVLLQ